MIEKVCPVRDDNSYNKFYLKEAIIKELLTVHLLILAQPNFSRNVKIEDK